MKLTIFIISVIFLQTIAQTPNRNSIDYFYGTAVSNMNNMEAKVKLKLISFNSLVKICSSNLKASNLPKNFTDVFDKFATKILEIQTMTEHQISYFDVSNLTDYDYTQFRISTLHWDVRHLRNVEEDLRINSTILYNFKNQVMAEYYKNWLTLTKIPSKNKLVNQVIRQIIIFYKDTSSYCQLLRVQTNNFQKLNLHLSRFIVNKTLLPTPNTTSDTYFNKLREIESKLVPMQQSLITSMKTAIVKIETALKITTTKSVQSSNSNTRYILNDLKYFFTKTSTVNDFPLLGWPQIPILMPEDVVDRSRGAVTNNKQKTYEDISEKSKKNQTQTKSRRSSISTLFQTVQSARKVQAPLPDYMAVLNATIMVENTFDRYNAKLDWAAGETVKLRSIMLTWPIKPEPCGNLMAYNTIVDTPANLGFPSGIYFDGSLVYPGTADSGCGFIVYQNPTAARISTSTSGQGPGGYSSCASGSNSRFDNTNAKFYLNSIRMKWITTNQANYKSVPGVLAVNNGIGTYFVGRVNLTSGNKVFQQIGKIETGNNQGEVWFYNPVTNSQQSSANFDVLTCEP